MRMVSNRAGANSASKMVPGSRSALPNPADDFKQVASETSFCRPAVEFTEHAAPEPAGELLPRRVTMRLQEGARDRRGPRAPAQ